MVVGPVTVPSGSEITECTYFKNPSHKDMAVNHVRIAVEGGSHHIHLYRPIDRGMSVADGHETCNMAVDFDVWQLIFASQAFPALNLTLTRKVFVSRNNPYARWLNIVTNTGSAAAQVGITLRGLIASANQTKVTNTSNGGTLNAQTNWFTSAQIVPLKAFDASGVRIGTWMPRSCA
jgi:hypothetical protein